MNREGSWQPTLVSHEKLVEAVEPAMADLNHPAARLLGRVASLGVSFLPATDNMRDLAVECSNSVSNK